MSTDYRALCAELTEKLHELTSLYEGHESELTHRAFTALAQTEPVVPTDEELYELWNSEGIEADFQDCRRFARAYAARWGTPAIEPVAVSERYWGRRIAIKRGGVGGSSKQPILPTIQPVPVSERLPEAGDWVWHCYAGVRFWEHGRYNGRQFFIGDGPESQPATHWRPANALPTPEATND